MGVYQRRLLAAAASFAVAASSIGFVAPAIAAPTTTVTDEQVTEPTNSPPQTGTASADNSGVPVDTEASQPALTQEPSVPATAAAEPALYVTSEAPPVNSAESLNAASESGTTFGQVFGLLGSLKVLPESTVQYDRSLFEHWIDADGDGCHTRKEVLLAESQVPATVGANCTVTAGQWTGWYGGGTAYDASAH